MAKFLRAVIITAVLAGVTLSVAAPALMGQLVTPGNVYGITPEMTVLGVNRAIQSASGTMIMQKDNLTMFMWTIEHGWAFLVLDNTKAEVIRNFHSVTGGGNYVNARTMADLVAFLEKHDWEIISAAEVSASIKSATAAWLTVMASPATLTTFIVMPAGLLDLYQMQILDYSEPQ